MLERLIGGPLDVASVTPGTTLDYWGNIWAIVAGVIAAALFVSALGRAAWRYLRRPILTLECGNGDGFDRKISISSPDVAAFVGGRPVVAVYGKTFTIRETNGGIARSVEVRVSAVETPGEPPDDLPYTLTWIHGGEQQEISPHGRKRVLFQRIFISARPERKLVYDVQSPVDSSSPQTITVEVWISGKRHLTKRLVVSNSWPGLMLMASEKEVPDPFPFPSVVAAD